jgi:hypothetical protein
MCAIVVSENDPKRIKPLFIKFQADGSVRFDLGLKKKVV